MMKTEIFPYTIGQSKIFIVKHYKEPLGNTLFVNLHDDEFVSVLAALDTIEEKGGCLIEIKANSRTPIYFRMEGEEGYYLMNPNRCFSLEGTRADMNALGRHSLAAEKEVLKFMEYFKGFFKGFENLVAVHNGRAIEGENDQKHYNINWYRKGGRLEEEVEELYINSDYKISDFFFTTSKEVFDKVCATGMSVVLQKGKVRDNGNMSWWCAREGLVYVNCEAYQPDVLVSFDIKDALSVQKIMLRKLVELLP